jgi:GNAT superfamily N-acetyltransferase
MQLKLADYKTDKDPAAIEMLMTHSSMDPMGGGEPLPNEVLSNLRNTLATIPNGSIILIYDEQSSVALATALQGFSTFKCQLLLNIHDVIVLPEYRGCGLAKRLVAELESLAVHRGCCKLTPQYCRVIMLLRRCASAAALRPMNLTHSRATLCFGKKT